MKHPPPAVELAVRVTTKLTFAGAGGVVRVGVSLPAGAAAGTDNIDGAAVPSAPTKRRPQAVAAKPAHELSRAVVPDGLCAVRQFGANPTKSGQRSDRRDQFQLCRCIAAFQFAERCSACRVFKWKCWKPT